MDVEIEQRRLTVPLFADRPGERRRDQRSAHAAANADDTHHMVRFVVVHVRVFWSRQHRLRHGQRFARSEEHTSELQSLMRISYAVFCLKKKKKHKYPRRI